MNKDERETYLMKLFAVREDIKVIVDIIKFKGLTSDIDSLDLVYFEVCSLIERNAAKEG